MRDAFVRWRTARRPSRALDRSLAGAHDLDSKERCLPRPVLRHSHSWIRCCSCRARYPALRPAACSTLDAGVAEFRHEGKPIFGSREIAFSGTQVDGWVTSRYVTRSSGECRTAAENLRE